jgi:hypothetical protein
MMGPLGAPERVRGICGLCRQTLAPEIAILESCAHMCTTRLSPFPDPVMLLEMVRHVLLA